jgi:TetR/AcrR family transcriptional repressor of mexJK operon
MKHWSADHPKAKLMAAKRASILEAAREAFLRLGYEGASMEGIASAAGVSIMTLYRHAPGKEDLFAAVISQACTWSDEAKHADFARTMALPLRDVLVEVGLMFQDKLASPQTVALLRAVMAETSRFPQLAEAAYQGFVGGYEETLDEYLGLRPEAGGVSAAGRRKLATGFISRLVGSDILRVLLGLEGASDEERQRRAQSAAGDLIAVLVASG